MEVGKGKGLASALGNTPMYSRQKYVIMSYAIENINRRYKDRIIYILSHRQAVIK
jgi:hypothetical protein